MLLASGKLLATDLEVNMPAIDQSRPIVVFANGADRWQQGSYEVWLLRDGCEIRQGPVSARGAAAVIWLDRAKPSFRSSS